MIFYQFDVNSKPEPCYEKMFWDVIKDTREKKLDAMIKSLHEQWLAEVSTNGAESERAKQLAEGKKKLKKKLSLFIFQARCPNGDAKKENAVLNGLYMGDYDKLSPREMEEMRRRFTENDFALCRELGIVLVAVTPSGYGIRTVAKAHPDVGNIADNQIWQARKLGLKPDLNCQDPTHRSYAFSDVIYLDNELFTYENEEFERAYGDFYRKGGKGPLKTADPTAAWEQDTRVSSPPGKAEHEDHGGGHNEAPAGGGEEPCYHGVPYRKIIAEYWRQHGKNGKEPGEGDRNSGLLKLATNLRYICDNRESELLKVLPSLGLDQAEMRQIVRSACKYDMYLGMPGKLASVLKACGLSDDEAEPQAQEEGEEDAVIKRLNKEFKKIKLPPALQAVCSGVEPDLGVGAVLASLPMFYTLLTRISFTHFSGKEERLSGMTFVIGPAASGKSFICDIDKLLMTPLRKADKEARKEEDTYNERRELNKNKPEQPTRPHPVIRLVPIIISNAQLAKRLRDAVDRQDPDLHLHLHSTESELSTLISANKGGSWIEKNYVYCKAFHNEEWGMDYKNAEAVNGEVQVNYNLTVSGTDMDLYRFIPKDSILGGLPTRMMLFDMPDTRFKMIEKRRRTRTAEEEKLLTDTAYALDSLRGKVEAKKLTDEMYTWGERMTQLAALEDDDVIDQLRRRTPLIAVRAGITFAILQQLDDFSRGKPLKFNKQCIKFARFIADYTLAIQYRRFAALTQQQKEKYSQGYTQKNMSQRLALIYNQLPDEFSQDDMRALMPGKPVSAIYDTCKRWKKGGHVELVQNGRYRKVKTNP